LAYAELLGELAHASNRPVAGTGRETVGSVAGVVFEGVKHDVFVNKRGLMRRLDIVQSRNELAL